jgi:hypothetical protein
VLFLLAPKAIYTTVLFVVHQWQEILMGIQSTITTLSKLTARLCMELFARAKAVGAAGSLLLLGKIILTIVAIFLLAQLILALIRLLHHQKEPCVFIVITPPLTTETALSSTASLFSLMGGILAERSFLDRILLRHSSLSFEIISQKESGIRYFFRVPTALAPLIEKNIRAYSSGVLVQESLDYLPELIEKKYRTRIREFKLSKSWALPIGEPTDLADHDPLSYLTSQMTHLEDGEILAIQLVIRSLHSKRKVNKLRRIIHANKFSEWVRTGSSAGVAQTVGLGLEAAVRLALSPLILMAETLTGQKTPLVQPARTKPIATPFELDLELQVKSKLNQPLFESSLRSLILVAPKKVQERERGIRSSFASFLHRSGQGFVPKIGGLKRVQLWKYRTRFPEQTLILSPTELSGLYHFPHTTQSPTEDLMRVQSRVLPAPLSLKKKGAPTDVILGVNHYAGTTTPIGITLSERQRHMYVIGKTGMGKTTLLTSAIYQDMVSGKGVAVFDPHGDMFQELLQIIPEDRIDDVVVFDPSDREFPIGLNILQPGIPFESDDDRDEWITSSILAIFGKLTDKQYWGPRMEHILRNTVLTALQTPNPSLYTLQQLLTDKKYQKKVATSLKDPILKQFWRKEFALLGTMQLSNVTAPLTQRLGHFITTKMSRHILLQEKSTLRVSEIMDQGKILLVNLSKGDLGEDQSFFFGTILTSIIWMAAYQRTKIPEKDRRDFFLYVDEFQNFATPRFSEIMSEGRKFHIALIASHQNIAQIEDLNLLKTITGNASTIMSLRASPDDEAFILPFMAPAVEKGDIVNLPPYHFFMKLGGMESEQAFSGETIPLKIAPNEFVKETVIKESRARFATPRRAVEAFLDTLLGGNTVSVPRVAKVPKLLSEMPVAIAHRKDV